MSPDELQQWIDTHGWRRADLAVALGVHPVTLAKWCAGLQAIGHPEMLALALESLERRRPDQHTKEEQ